jgi:signal transduction histidine kinase
MFESTAEDPLTYSLLEGSVDLLAAKEEAEAATARINNHQRVRATFLAQVSHDLRTPLNSILGFIELMQIELGGQADVVADHFAAIRRNGRVLQGLIDDLLDVASMDAGQLALRRANVHVLGVIEDVRAAVDPGFLAGRYQVTWPRSDALAGMQAFLDRRRIVQALVNLMENARAHTAPGGCIELSVTAGAGALRFEVIDNGKGIAPEDQVRVFQPFVRLGSAQRAGAGLGLAIVRGIAQGHDGTIEVESQIGLGSRFTLAIPMEAP